MYTLWKWAIALVNLGIALYNLKKIMDHDYNLKRELVFEVLGIISVALWSRSLHQYELTVGYVLMGIVIFFEMGTTFFAMAFSHYDKKHEEQE